jgi:hypothetical protein
VTRISEKLTLGEPLRWGFDMDDVLFPTGELTIQINNETYGTDLQHGDWYGGDWRKWGVKREEDVSPRVNEICNDPEFARRIRPLVGSRAVLRAMHDRGDYAAIITGRPSGPQSLIDLRPVTLNLLDTWHPGVFPEEHVFMTSHFAEHRVPKVNVLKGLVLDGYFEDHTHHANEAAPEGVPTYLFGEYDWNREGVHEMVLGRLAHWAGIATVAGLDGNELDLAA